MDNKKEHKLNMLDRQQAQVTGIKKVISVDEELIVLITDVGKMTIKGSKLHAGKLDVETGILEFTGEISSIIYVDYKTAGQKASGLVGRLFK